MKIGTFEIVCTRCMSKNVVISNYHSCEADGDRGVRVRCNDCGSKVEL